jgi:hypothetical protein
MTQLTDISIKDLPNPEDPTLSNQDRFALALATNNKAYLVERDKDGKIILNRNGDPTKVYWTFESLTDDGKLSEIRFQNDDITTLQSRIPVDLTNESVVNILDKYTAIIKSEGKLTNEAEIEKEAKARIIKLVRDDFIEEGQAMLDSFAKYKIDPSSIAAFKAAEMLDGKKGYSAGEIASLLVSSSLHTYTTRCGSSIWGHMSLSEYTIDFIHKGQIEGLSYIYKIVFDDKVNVSKEKQNFERETITRDIDECGRWKKRVF